MSLKADQCKGEGVFNNHTYFACDFVTFHLKITNTVILHQNASDIPGGMGRDLNPGSKHGDPLPLKNKTCLWGLLAQD